MGERHRRLLSSIGTLRLDLWERLRHWKSIQGDYYVCSVRLSSGEDVPCAVLMPKDSKERQAWYARRGFIRDYYVHDSDMIEVSSLVDVRPCLSRTPPLLLQKMLNQGGTHMFGWGVRFVLKDGTVFWHTSGEGLELEFTTVPQGYSVSDIVEVQFPTSEECKTMPSALSAPSYRISLFVPPGPALADVN